MDDTLPNDLPGGWNFNKPFIAVPLEVGQVWRKAGPADAIKIVRVMQPGHSEYDGGLPGISVRRSEIAKKVRWLSDTEFWPGNVPQLQEGLKTHGYALCG